MGYARTYDGLDRRKYSSFRVLAVLQFGIYKDLIETKEGGEIVLHSVNKLGKKLHLRPMRLRAILAWLHETGYLRVVRDVTGGQGLIMILTQPTNILPGTPRSGAYTK